MVVAQQRLASADTACSKNFFNTVGNLAVLSCAVRFSCDCKITLQTNRWVVLTLKTRSTPSATGPAYGHTWKPKVVFKLQSTLERERVTKQQQVSDSAINHNKELAPKAAFRDFLTIGFP